MQTVQKVRRQINPKLKIEGILLTMTDSRTNYGKQISNLIRQAYGKHLKVFEQTIPRSVRAAETSAAGKSIFAYDPKGKVSEATNLLQRRCWRMPIDSGNLALKGLDDLFSTEENRQEEQREQVQQIPIDALHPFINHPFKVLDDEAMTRTVESIAQYGVLAPLIARPRPDGDGYEIISGHRRQYAAKLAGLDTLPVIVRNMDDNAAVLLMVDSNLQREHILPSESFCLQNEAGSSKKSRC